MTIQEMENVFSKLEGKDPEDYEDLHDHINDEDDIYNESYIFDKGNYEQNLDKWAPGTPLWIAGASGDGKSTLAKKYAKEHKATLAPLDIFLCRIAGTKEKFEKFLKDDTGTVMNEGSKIILDYIDKHPEITWSKSGDEYFDRGQNPELWNQLFNWLLKVTKNDPKYNKNLYIFEGCSICMMDIDKAKKLPIIVTGTSRLTGSRRRMHRDTEEHSDYSILKVIWRELKRITGGNFKKLNDNKDKFIKNLSKTIQESDEGTTKGYRYTDGRDGEGIYEALKAEMYQKNGLTPAPWREFLDSDAAKWLPKPPKYDKDNESWFTEEGNEKFKELTLPIVKEYIKNIKVETKDIPNERIVYLDEYQFITDNSIPITVQEATLSTKERNKLDDSEFGIPELRKYPLTDKKHVRSAVSYFHKAPRKYKVKLAKRILRAAHKYNMDTKDWDTINEYAHKKHIRVQEFVDPIAKLKDDVSGSMNFMNYLMKVDLLTKGSVSESLKQLKHSAPNGLHPIMFMGYMDPEGVNRSELKDLEKQVIYADDENNIYSCFFNSHARRHEISQIASSFETFINDLPKRKTSQPNIIKAYANPMIELKKDDRIIHSHHELPFTSLDNGSDGCYMNTYYSYFAILEAFEFKRNQLYHDICNVILDQFDGDEDKFDFRSVEVKQVNWATAEILFRFKYDNDSFIVVIRTVSMKTQPAKLYHDNSPKNEDGDAYVGGDDFEEINHNDTNVENTEDEDASMTEMCIGSNEFGVCYQEFDDNGKIKITNVPYNMMYFGSYKDFGNNMIKLQNPRLFVTPFKGIASIFTIDRSRYMIPKGKSCNLAYDEWKKDTSQLDKPFDDVHVKVEGIPEMEHRSFENEGWIYGIDISKLKDHIYQEPWMDSEREFLILDVDEIPIAMKLNHKTVVYVEGADRNDVKEAPSNENVFYSNHRVPIDEKTVKKYMKKGNADLTIGLQHLHVNDKVTGYIWDTKDGNIVAYVAVEEKKDGNWIVAFELSNKYQGKGYGKQLLDFAENELNADHLSVDKNNKHAIDLYSENGWETYKDSDSMLFMKKNTSDENIQEAAYTNEGINKANVRPVKIVYRRFSTKNDEQYEPIKKFWEIFDKYFPKPHMTCGFGWDWTDNPDFAYGIIINEKEIPPEFMPELKSAFPDVVFDENFLIPKHYEKSFNCSLAKCQETYDEIWDKGPLTCELEEYPSDGQMKISVIYKKDKAELENELSEHIKTVKEDDEDDIYNESYIGEATVPSGKVAFLYKKWSTKNKEQFNTLDVFWDIINKYIKDHNIPISNVCGYGTDWTGYGTDFVYGTFFKNQQTIPNDLLETMKKKIPDIKVKDLNIPTKFDGYETCSNSEMEQTYDKIWDKGFLMYELEEYPDDDTIKIYYKYKVLYSENEEWNERWEEYKKNKKPVSINESYIQKGRNLADPDGIIPGSEKSKEELEQELAKHIKTVKEDDKDTTVVDNFITAQETFFLDIQESLIPLKREGKEWEHSNGEYTFENENIHMRPATEDDIENMYQWEMESIDQSLADNEKVQSLIRQDCHDSLKDTLMIMDGDNTIGMFTACMIDNGEWRYIGEIYLIPEYRGQGIGSTILRNEMANYDKIRLQVAMDNEGAFKLYTSLGFKIAKEDDTNRMYIMEYVKPENIQETVTVDGHRLIELAYYKKITNLTPEQEQILQDYANARDQLQAAAAYYTRETKARKKALKRMQLEHNTSKSEYQRDQLNRKMARTRIELDVLARDYAEAYQRNVQTMNQLADKFDEIELSKKNNPTPSPMNDTRDSITIPIPKILRKPRELLGSFLNFEDEKDDDTEV